MSYIGTTKIGKMYLGDVGIAKAYLGNDLVFQNGGSPTPPAPIYDAEVEYLQSSGTEYIDTGINADSGISAEIQLANHGTSWDAAHSPSGAITTSSPYVRHYLAYGSGSDGVLCCWNTSVINSRVKPSNDVSFIVKVDAVGKVLYVNGANKGSLSSATFDVGQNFLLFARGGVFAGSNTRIYYAKLWDGADLVRDFIPVRVGTTGYMYDRVSGQLFGNGGSGDFTLGNDKNQ